MKTISLAFLFCITTHFVIAQCTIDGPGTVDWDDAVCDETGLAPVSGDLIIVPDGVILQFSTNTPDPKHTGDFEIYGKVEINKSDVRIIGDIHVFNGGHLEITEKLRIGPDATGCGNSLAIESGGLADFPGTGSNDKLFICGEEIARAGGGGCNADYPNGDPPYCEPGGGFTGPTGFDEDGYEPTLPVVLLSFKVAITGTSVQLDWSTLSEENFDFFIVQRSADGSVFENIAKVPGQKRDIYKQISKYSFEDITPVLGYNFYRLKAVDLDGSFEYFGIKSARIEGDKSFSVFPNPGLGNSVSISTNFSPSSGDRVKLLNTFGKELLTMEVSGNVNKLELLEHLTPGVYFLQYEGPGYSKTVRLLIQK